IEKANHDIYSLLSSDDCEDIVGIYLQLKHNYMIVPSSCKSDTMFYEFVLLNRNTHLPATVQVKNGKVNLHIDEYINEHEEDVYLFTTIGDYIGEKKSYIHCLCPEKLRRFIFYHADALPKKVQVWIEFVNRGVDGE